jgi:hypothetical protein
VRWNLPRILRWIRRLQAAPESHREIQISVEVDSVAIIRRRRPAADPDSLTKAEKQGYIILNERLPKEGSIVSNQYLQSAYEGLVFDIKDPVASGSPLQALGPKLESNQYWSTKDVPGQPGYFWIVSGAKDSGGDELVVDISTPVQSGSLLQALVQKSEANQWWTFKDVPGQPGYSWIVSAAKDSNTGDELVVDMKTPLGSGSPLQALAQKNESNQWWTLANQETAPTPNNFGSYANYLLYSGCKALTGVSVTITVTKDLVGSNGFSFQLNTTSIDKTSAGTAPSIVWQQYCVVVGTDIEWVINNWTAQELSTKGGLPQFNQRGPFAPYAPLSPNQLPAGSQIKIILMYDAQNNVTGAQFVLSVPGSYLAAPFIQLVATKSQADLAPISAFELDLVGPDGGQFTNLSSGEGSIAYAASSPLTALSALPACTASHSTTGETSNSLYGPLPTVASNLLTQTFSTAPAEAWMKASPGKSVLARPTP